MNKWISLAVLVLTVFSFSVVCQDTSSASVPTDYTDISEGQTVSVTVASERYFRFMPADTGYYRYSSSGSGSPQGAVLDFSGEVLYSNDDIGYNENFGMVVPMKGGSVYYLRSEAFGEESGGYSVKIAKVDMTPTPIGVSGTYGLYDSGNGSDDYLFPVSSGDVNNMSPVSGYDINVGSGDIVPVGSPFTLSHVLLSDMGVSVGCTGFGDAVLSLDDLTSGYRIVLGPLDVRSVPAYHFIVGHVYVFTVEAMSEPLGLRSLTVRADLFTDEVPGHYPASSTVHPPTCTEDGYVDIFSSDSDAPVLKVVLPALGHDYIRDGLEYHCSHDGSHDFKVTLTTEGSGRLDYEGVSYGEVMEVTAVPSEGYVFEGWYLDGCLVSDTPVLNLKISMSTEYTAVFVPMVLVRGASIFIGHVVMGTPFDEIELPSTVLCTRSDGSSVPVTVQWASDGYDPGAIGGFSLHAAIPSPYVVLGAEVVAYGDVIWHVPDPIAIAFIEVPSVVMEFGDRFAHPCVYGMSEDLRIPMAVKWDVKGFDPTDVRTVSLSGTVTVPYGYVLGDGVSGNVSMDVTVVPREITSFNGPELGVFPEDSTVENLGLPSSVGVTVTNGTVYLPVSWDVSGFSSDRGEHSISGTMTVPYGYELSPGIDASVEAHYTVSSVVSDIADIVFVVDTTGSMVQEIKNVRKNISAFVSGLSDDGISARLALVEYKDITFDGRDSTKVAMGPDGAWFTDPSMFAENIDQLKVDGGGDHPETVIDALETARSLEFRPGAYRFVVLVTDDTFKTDNTRGIRSMSEEISNLTSDSICVSVITSHLMRPVYSDLTESTGGALLNIYGDFGVEIGSLIWVIGAVIIDGNAVGLDLVSEPWRTEYCAGEYFNGTGLVVDAVFDNGERTLEHCSVTPSRPLTASDRNVTVHYRGMTLDIPIVVREDAISVTGVSVEGQGILMKVGEKVVLSADILPDDASFTDVVWVSSDVSCVDVSDGVLTARSAGSAVVTVSTLDGGHYATCPVSVYGYGDTDGLSFDVDGLVMHTGMVRTLTLNPSSFYAVWDTSDPSVCTVEDGKVVAKHPGMAVVTATVDGYVATCNVLVEATATFMTKGFVYAVQHYVQGSVIDPPVPDTDRFVGWNGYTEGMTIYEDKVFDAVFDGDVCVIVFATGTHDIVRVVEPGDTIVAPSVIPVKENEGGKYYTFLRWDGYTEGMVADRDRVFDAVYDCSVYHTVTVNYNDGTVGKYLVPHGQRLENVPDVYMYFSNSEYTKVWSPQNSITKDLSLYATIEVSGHSGPMISWVFRFDTHVFTISGKGAMLDYEYNSQRPWHEYRSYIRDVVVNEGVTSIGSRSFSDCANLNNVTLPDSLVSLGKYAFYEDLNLDSINFGTSLRSVKYQALQGISFQYPNGTRVPILPEKLAGSVYKGKDGQMSLYHIEGDWGTIHWVYDRYDESLTITGKGAIPDCVDPTDIPWYNEKELIKTVTIGEGITTIGELAFRRFTSLEKVELPSTLKSIRMHAFQYVSTLKGIEFGTALNNVGWEAFESLSFKLLDGTSLKADANILSGSRFTGSDGVMYMVSTQGTSGDLKWYLNADVLRFEGTGSMADYKGPSSTPWYTYRLFIRTLVIDEGVTHIGDYAFQKYRALANVYLPDSLQSIGYHSFYSDVKIKHIEFGTGLKSLGTYAFYGNTFKDGSKTLTNSSASLRGHVFEGGKGVLVLKS